MSARRKVVAADQIKIFHWIADYEDFFILEYHALMNLHEVRMIRNIH